MDAEFWNKQRKMRQEIASISAQEREQLDNILHRRPFLGLREQMDIINDLRRGCSLEIALANLYAVSEQECRARTSRHSG